MRRLKCGNNKDNQNRRNASLYFKGYDIRYVHSPTTFNGNPSSCGCTTFSDFYIL